MPDLPSATTTLAGLSAWSSPIFNALTPYAYMAAGVLIGIGLIGFVIWIGGMVLHHLTHRGQ